MKRFADLILALDQTNKTGEKVEAMRAYFASSPDPADAAWALFFLAGRRLNRAVKTQVMAEAAMIATDTPGWLFDECWEAVGDFSETCALLLANLPRHESAPERSLAEAMRELVIPITAAQDDGAARRLLLHAWMHLAPEHRFVFNKMLRGNFRIGIQRPLVIRALAQAHNREPASIALRLSGTIEPTPEFFSRITAESLEADEARPYPFCLADTLDIPLEDLGDPAAWLVEYKLDGIRAQVLKRSDAPPVIWSRGEELITHQFPELVSALTRLPFGTVLDGEILAWRDLAGAARESNPLGGLPLGFNALQTRLNRKRVEATLFDVDTITFVAFDVLEHEGRDIRALALADRRQILETLIAPFKASGSALIRTLDPVDFGTWQELERERARSRILNVEGLMLKPRASAYHVGRIAGARAVAGTVGQTSRQTVGQTPRLSSGAQDSSQTTPALPLGWWKWKIEPYSVDAVLMYAQQGSGRRAGLFTDYTFGVWETLADGSRALVAFAKAYSGLTNEEIKKVDKFIRGATLERKGPVRIIRPDLVFEIGFEAIRESDRHRSGIAVRFPRMLRWRTDKKPEEADTIESVRKLLSEHVAREQRETT